MRAVAWFLILGICQVDGLLCALENLHWLLAYVVLRGSLHRWLAQSTPTKLAKSLPNKLVQSLPTQRFSTLKRMDKEFTKH